MDNIKDLGIFISLYIETRFLSKTKIGKDIVPLSYSKRNLSIKNKEQAIRRYYNNNHRSLALKDFIHRKYEIEVYMKLMDNLNFGLSLGLGLFIYQLSINMFPNFSFNSYSGLILVLAIAILVIILMTVPGFFRSKNIDIIRYLCECELKLLKDRYSV